jgi:hypothetical protein
MSYRLNPIQSPLDDCKSFPPPQEVAHAFGRQVHMMAIKTIVAI